MRQIFYPIICLFLMTLLQSCMDIATSGAQALYNHHSIKKQLSDQYITMQANLILKRKTKAFENAHISVATYNGEILLAGQVPYAWQKDKASQLIKTIPNVKEIYNQLTLAQPSSALTRLSDAWITTKVKSRLIASADVDATQVKVVTENGVVYLMGILPATQAEAAIEIASTTQGVLKVVKIFSYVTISKKIQTEVIHSSSAFSG